MLPGFKTDLASAVLLRYTRFVSAASTQAQMLLLPQEQPQPQPGVIRQTVEQIWHIQNCITQNTAFHLNISLRFLQGQLGAATALALAQEERREAMAARRPPPAIPDSAASSILHLAAEGPAQKAEAAPPPQPRGTLGLLKQALEQRDIRQVLMRHPELLRQAGLGQNSYLGEAAAPPPATGMAGPPGGPLAGDLPTGTPRPGATISHPRQPEPTSRPGEPAVFSQPAHTIPAAPLAPPAPTAPAVSPSPRQAAEPALTPAPITYRTPPGTEGGQGAPPDPFDGASPPRRPTADFLTNIPAAPTEPSPITPTRRTHPSPAAPAPDGGIAPAAERAVSGIDSSGAAAITPPAASASASAPAPALTPPPAQTAPPARYHPQPRPAPPRADAAPPKISFLKEQTPRVLPPRFPARNPGVGEAADPNQGSNPNSNANANRPLSARLPSTAARLALPDESPVSGATAGPRPLPLGAAPVQLTPAAAHHQGQAAEEASPALRGASAFVQAPAPAAALHRAPAGGEASHPAPAAMAPTAAAPATARYAPAPTVYHREQAGGETSRPAQPAAALPEIKTIHRHKTSSELHLEEALPRQTVSLNARGQEGGGIAPQALQLAVEEAVERIDLTRITDRVYRELSNRLRTERKKRGM